MWYTHTVHVQKYEINHFMFRLHVHLQPPHHNPRQLLSRPQWNVLPQPPHPCQHRTQRLSLRRREEMRKNCSSYLIVRKSSKWLRWMPRNKATLNKQKIIWKHPRYCWISFKVQFVSSRLFQVTQFTEQVALLLTSEIMVALSIINLSISWVHALEIILLKQLGTSL